MNRNTLIALAVALAAGAAAADDITLDASRFESAATRAQVQSELAAFRQSDVNPWSDHHDPLARFSSQRTRADATAEYLGERERVAAFTGEDSGSSFLAQRRGPRAVQTLAGRPAAGAH